MKNPVSLQFLTLMVLLSLPARGNDTDKCLVYLEHLEGAGVASTENPYRFRLEIAVKREKRQGSEILAQLDPIEIKIARPLIQGPALPVYLPNDTDETQEFSLGVSYGSIAETDETTWTPSGLYGENGFEIGDRNTDQVFGITHRSSDKLIGTVQMTADLNQERVFLVFQSYTCPNFRQSVQFNTDELHSGRLGSAEFVLPQTFPQQLSNSIAGVSYGLRERFGDSYMVIPRVNKIHIEREIKTDWPEREAPLYTGHYPLTDFKPFQVSTGTDLSGRLKGLYQQLSYYGTPGNYKFGKGQGRVWVTQRGENSLIVVDFHNETTNTTTNLAFEIQKKG